MITATGGTVARTGRGRGWSLFMAGLACLVLGLGIARAEVGDPVRVVNFDDWPAKTAYEPQLLVHDFWTLGGDCMVHADHAHSVRSARLRRTSTSAPFVLSPSLPDGIGLIEFLYRRWPGDTQVSLQVEVSVDGESWSTVALISSAVDTEFTFHSYLVNDANAKYMRLYSNAGTTARFLIDEINVTKPLRNPEGSVWINEIDYAHYWDESWIGINKEFIELAGPAGSDISGWRIEIEDLLHGADVQVYELLENTVLTDDHSGFGFFVLGGPDLVAKDMDLGDYLLPSAGGIRLYNELGLLEYSLSYAATATGYTLIPATDDDFVPPHVDSVILVGTGRSYTDFFWTSSRDLGGPTPGAINPGQSFGNPAEALITPTSLRFRYLPGQPSPADQTFTVRNESADGALTYTISVPRLHRGWLSVSPLEGTLQPSEELVHTVSADSTGQTMNRWTELTVMGQAWNLPQTVAVSLEQGVAGEPLLFYNFDRGQGDVAVNTGTVGKAGNLKFGGGATWTPGASGVSGDYALLLSGGSDHASTPAPESDAPLGPGNLILWLDAADEDGVVLEGGGISQWRDKSHAQLHAEQPTAGQRPTLAANALNGQPVVAFNSSLGQTMTGSMIGAFNQSSIFMVFRRDTGTHRWARLFSMSLGTTVDHQGGNYIPILRHDDTGTIGTHTSGAMRSAITVGWGEWHLFGHQYTGSQISNRLNGGAASLNNITRTFNFDRYGLGARMPTANTEYLNGAMAEVLMFKTSLSDVDREKMEGYLAHKWWGAGAANRLPATHAFKVNPPDIPDAAANWIPSDGVNVGSVQGGTRSGWTYHRRRNTDGAVWALTPYTNTGAVGGPGYAGPDEFPASVGRVPAVLGDNRGGDGTFQLQPGNWNASEEGLDLLMHPMSTFSVYAEYTVSEFDMFEGSNRTLAGSFRNLDTRGQGVVVSIEYNGDTIWSKDAGGPVLTMADGSFSIDLEDVKPGDKLRFVVRTRTSTGSTGSETALRMRLTGVLPSAMPELDHLDALTITGWLKTDSTADGLYRIAGNRSGSGGFDLALTDGHQRLAFRSSGVESTQQLISTPMGWSDGAWNFFAVTVDFADAGDEALRFYRGAGESALELVSAHPLGALDRPGASSVPFHVGSLDGWGIDGAIDDLRVYGEVLDALLLQGVRLEADREPKPPEAPVITTQPQSATRIAPQSVLFEAWATGEPPPSYQWYHAGEPITGATKSTYFIQNVTRGAHDGEYHVVATNSEGTATSAVAVLTVHTWPTITQEPRDIWFKAGETAVFTVEADGYPDPTFQWRFEPDDLAEPAIDLPNADEKKLTITNMQKSDRGFYSVAVTNAAGTVFSRRAQLGAEVPPAFFVHPVSAEVDEWTSVSFTAEASGLPPPAYQWYHNDLEIPGETDKTLTIHEVRRWDAGVYQVKATNSSGTASSMTATLSVTAIFDLPYIETFEEVALGGGPAAFGWLPGLHDASKVVDDAYTYEERRPASGAHTKVLEVDAQYPAKALIKMEDAPVEEVYLDLMMRFDAYTKHPDKELEDDGIKLALYLQAEDEEALTGHLMLFHGGEHGTTAVSPLTGIFNVGGWYRVTVMMDLSVIPPFFRVLVDGEELPRGGFAEAETDSTYGAGPWFRFANYEAQQAQGAERRLNWMALQGLGRVDDIVLTHQTPQFGALISYFVRTVLEGPGAMNPAGKAVTEPFPSFEIEVTEGEAITIIYTADQYYEIGELDSSGQPVSAAAGEPVYEWTFGSVHTDISNRVVFVESIWAVEDGGDGKSPWWWAVLVKEADGTSLSVYDGYLLNQKNLDTPFRVIEFGRNEADRAYLKWTSSGEAHGVVEVRRMDDLMAAGGFEAGTLVPGTVVHDEGVNTWTADELWEDDVFYGVRILPQE